MELTSWIPWTWSSHRLLRTGRSYPLSGGNVVSLALLYMYTGSCRCIGWKPSWLLRFYGCLPTNMCWACTVILKRLPLSSVSFAQWKNIVYAIKYVNTTGVYTVWLCWLENWHPTSQIHYTVGIDSLCCPITCIQSIWYTDLTTGKYNNNSCYSALACATHQVIGKAVIRYKGFKIL